MFGEDAESIAENYRNMLKTDIRRCLPHDEMFFFCFVAIDAFQRMAQFVK
jgi:hypothetical protein